MHRRMEYATLGFVHPLAPEDRARANFYGVLAALFADAPNAALLRAIGTAQPLPEAESGSLPQAWNRLVAACQAMDPEAARQEYWDLFVGTGKSEVNLHASHWRSGFMMEKPLVELRDDLARLGLGRKPGTTMVEDHVSALFETMRLLIEGENERRPASLTEQRGFFERHMAPWLPDLCTALRQAPLANFYRPVGEFAELFVAIERDSLAID
jgi:TorA maturation chaperone TorD